MTEPSTDRTRSVRKLRHSIRKRTYMALQLTGGQPGLSKDQQVAVVDKQIELLKEALAKAEELRQIVANRDFDAYKAKKDAVAQAPEVEKVEVTEESAMADLTFAEIVAQLETKADAQEAAKWKHPSSGMPVEDIETATPDLAFPQPDEDQPPF